MRIRVMSVGSGTVWGVDPMLRTADFDNTTELRGYSGKRALKEKNEAGQFYTNKQFFFVILSSWG